MIFNHYFDYLIFISFLALKLFLFTSYNKRVLIILKNNNRLIATSMHLESYYKKIRNQYLPKKIVCVIIAESPPISGKYFYDKRGEISEPLFKAVMKLIKSEPKDKESGLRTFQNKGLFLVDATYKPVNNLPISKRNKKILENFDNLIKDLRKLKIKKQPLMLIKSNVCRLIEPKLNKLSFNVINKNRIVPFPSHGHQKKFLNRAKKTLIEIQELK